MHVLYCPIRGYRDREKLIIPDFRNLYFLIEANRAVLLWALDDMQLLLQLESYTARSRSLSSYASQG